MGGSQSDKLQDGLSRRRSAAGAQQGRQDRQDRLRPPAGEYSGINKLHWNTFDDGIGKCTPRGPQVLDDHIFVNPLLGYVNPQDNPCKTGSLNIGGGGRAQEASFNPRSTFGHMHPGPAEWWIVQVGQISGRFENAGEFHAVEGDVLYAAPMSWHEMAAEAHRARYGWHWAAIT
jgi:hypothetical protein